MDDINVNKFVSNIAKKYYSECNFEYEDLRQELLLEYYKVINKQSFLDKKLNTEFNNSAYIYRSLTNRCIALKKSKLKIVDNEPIFFDSTNEEFIESLSPNNYYLDNINSKDNILDAINLLDNDSKAYVVSLGYLKADLTFLADEFDNITKDCSEEEVKKVKEEPSDKNISLYIMKSNPRKIKYIKSKLKNNKTFLKILQNY